MSEFRAALRLCGLSQADAAPLLGVSPSSVDKWSRGLSAPPDDVWQRLAGHWQAIEAAAAGKAARDAGIRVQAAALARLRDPA